MKISLEIIRNRIENAFKIKEFSTLDTSMTLTHVAFYDGEKALLPDRLYIVRKELLKKEPAVGREASLVLIGERIPTRWKKSDNYLVLMEDTNPFSLMNLIVRVFDRFCQWEAELLLLTGKEMLTTDFHRMLEVSSSIFENGLSIMDGNYKIVAEDETNLRYGNYPAQFVKENKQDIPSRIISEFKFNEDYQNIQTVSGVFLYEDDVLPHRCLCKNIFRGREFLFRLIVTECVREFRPDDEILLDYFSRLFLRGIEQSNLLSSGGQEKLIGILTETIDTGLVSRSALREEMQKLSWDIEDCYRMLYVQVSEQDLYLSALEYQCRELMRIFSDSLAFVYEDVLVCVLHDIEGARLEQMLSTFTLYVRENNFRAGFSNTFSGLYKIHDYYQQSVLALTLGMKKRPMQWIHFFQEVTFDYIRKKMTEDFAPEELVSPVYQRLLEYDSKKGTEYVRTLQVYLENNKNVVQTANQLFVHRATIIYRLKRISEIGRTDLENKRELLHLGLTFTLLEDL